MNISLTPELEAFVKELVASGSYMSSSEVMREALRLLKEQEDYKKRRIAQLNADIQKGLDSLARGERVPADQVFAELREMSRQRRRKTA